MLALVLSPGFEEMEAVITIDLLRRAGVKTQVTTFGLTDLLVTGSHNICVSADRLLADIDSSQHQALILPGGEPGVSNLEKDARILDLIREFYQANKLLAAICAAPRLLERAGVLENCPVAAYPSQKDFFQTGLYQPQAEVLNYKNKIITAKSAAFTIQFALEIITTIYGDTQMASEVASKIYFS